MSKPKLKNYTTTIPAKQSVHEIESLLINFGAVSTHKENENFEVKAIAFVMIGPDNNELPFRFAVTQEEILGIANYLNSAYTSKAGREPTEKELKHARNVAWKIMYDAVFAQLSLIQIGMRKIEQEFLPHLYDFKKKITFFQQIEKNGIAGLLNA